MKTRIMFFLSLALSVISCSLSVFAFSHYGDKLDSGISLLLGMAVGFSISACILFYRKSSKKRKDSYD